MFYLLTPFNLVFGTTGILVGTAVLNGLCALGAVVTAARRHPALPWLTAAVFVVLFRAGHQLALLADFWNPWFAVVPFAAFLLAAWSVAERDWPLLPWMVGLGSFVVQTHVGYFPFVLAGWVLAPVLAVAGHGSLGLALRRVGVGLRRGGAARRALLWTVVVGAVLWALPVVQQLTGDSANLRAIVEFLTGDHEALVGRREALRVLGAELRWNGPWVVGRDLTALGLVAPASPVQALVQVVVTLAAGVGAGLVGRSWSPLRFAVIVVTMCGVGVEAVARIDGPVYPYLVRWSWVLAGFLALSTVWSVGMVAAAVFERRAGMDRRDVASSACRPALGPRLVGMLGAGLAVLVAVSLFTSRVEAPEAHASDAVASLSAQLIGDEVRPGSTYLVTWVEPQTIGAVGTGLAVELLHRGVDVRLGRGFAQVAGKARTAARSEVSRVIWVVDRGDGSEARVPQGARPIASYDPLTPAQRRRVGQLVDALLADKPRGRFLPADLRVRLNSGDFDLESLVAVGFDRRTATELKQLADGHLGYDVYLEVGPPVPTKTPGSSARAAS